MSARKKLNVAFVNGSLVIAAVAGIATGSSIVFAGVAGVLIVSSIISDEIRLTSRGRRK
jgi:hypothetical protein